MKKKIKYGAVLISMFLLLIMRVNAKEHVLFYEYNYDYRYKVVGGTQAFDLVIYTIDGSTGYSLDPNTYFTSVFGTEDNAFFTQYTESEKAYLESIAYFGYDYDKTDKLRYMAAQELIWEYVTKEDVYWIDTSGQTVNIDAKKNEILSLVNDLERVPTFGTENIEANYFDEVKLIDQNGVLGSYEVINNSVNTVSVSGNTLTVKVKENKPTEIILKKKGLSIKSSHVFDYNPPLKIATFGMSREIVKKITVTPLTPPSAYLEIKFGSESDEINEAITFKISNNREEWIFTTDEHGYFLSDILFVEGEYQIETLTVPKKYDAKTIELSIQQELIDQNRKVSKQLILKEKLGSVSIRRMGTTIDTSKPIENMIYRLYAGDDIYKKGTLIYHKDDFIMEGKTNENGEMKLDNLPLGKYILKETSFLDYALFQQNIEITLDGNHPDYFHKIETIHIPIEISLLGKNNYDFSLVDENGKVIKKLSYGKTKLSIEFGNYRLQVQKDGKIIHLWDIDFTKENRFFEFQLSEEQEPIIFDMPKTGLKRSNFFFYITVFLFYKIFKKK